MIIRYVCLGPHETLAAARWDARAQLTTAIHYRAEWSPGTSELF